MSFDNKKKDFQSAVQHMIDSAQILTPYVPEDEKEEHAEMLVEMDEMYNAIGDCENDEELDALDVL